MTNKDLFLQLDRDIGTLIAMLGDSKLSTSDREKLTEIAGHMDDAMTALQAILYPDNTP